MGGEDDCVCMVEPTKPMDVGVVSERKVGTALLEVSFEEESVGCAGLVDMDERSFEASADMPALILFLSVF